MTKKTLTTILAGTLTLLSACESAIQAETDTQIAKEKTSSQIYAPGKELPSQSYEPGDSLIYIGSTTIQDKQHALIKRRCTAESNYIDNTNYTVQEGKTITLPLECFSTYRNARIQITVHDIKEDGSAVLERIVLSDPQKNKLTPVQ